MKFLTNSFIIIMAIFIGALVLRFFSVNGVPPAINWDEASLGYNAYSILNTGKDEWSRVMPLTFEAFGDYKLPGYIYTLTPFIAIFGLNEFSVRLPSMLFGGLSVVFLYLIVKELSGDKKWALISSLLLAISPWHLFLSRIALEANLALSFFLCGLLLLSKGLNKSILLIPASLLFGFSIFTYNSARIFVPLFLLFFIFLIKDKIKINRTSIISALIFSAFLIAGFYLAVFQDSSARYYWVRILDEGAISFLDQSRNASGYPPIITNLIYNRITYFIFNFCTNYFKHLSLQFLAISGGSNYQFSLQNYGMMYLAELPFLLFGFYQLLKLKIGRLFLLWFLLAPIPAALTREAPHALRSIFMLGSIQIITAYGLISFGGIFSKNKLKLKIISTVLSISLIISVVYYLKIYFNNYPVKYSQAWQYGYKEAVDTIGQNYEKYPRIYFTKKYGEPHIFYLFFSKYDPYKFQNNPDLVRYERSNWRWVDKLDKIFFLNDWELVNKLKDERNALVIASPENVPPAGRHLKTIYFLDGSKAFEIVEI